MTPSVHTLVKPALSAHTYSHSGMYKQDGRDTSIINICHMVGWLTYVNMELGGGRERGGMACMRMWTDCSMPNIECSFLYIKIASKINTSIQINIDFIFKIWIQELWIKYPNTVLFKNLKINVNAYFHK